MRLMGILNVTPDSFSDGGRWNDAAVDRGLALFEQGAEIVDVGGESTRPGATPVEPNVEAERVRGVVAALAKVGRVSVDTRRASVAAQALDCGATMVNDVSGGGDPEMFALVARFGCDYVLMHSRGTPATMASLARYQDVVAEVWAETYARRDAAIAAGISPARIWLDPGIGFAKTAEQNLTLLRALPRERLLLGASRKAFIGALTGQTVAAQRLEGSLAVALFAKDAGVDVLRVHDVAETRRALVVWSALVEGGR